MNTVASHVTGEGHRCRPRSSRVSAVPVIIVLTVPLQTTGALAALLLGAIPLASGRDAGAESRQQAGFVIVGRLPLGTVFTLFVVPIVYTLLATRKVIPSEGRAPLIQSLATVRRSIIDRLLTRRERRLAVASPLQIR